MFGIDAIVALAGLLIPPATDFIKKKFLKPGSDTPESTMSALATTRPEVLPQYIEAQTKYMQAQRDFFNRDVVGNIHSWVSDLRAAIRPLGVIGAGTVLSGMVYAAFAGYRPDPAVADTLTGVRLSCEIIVSSWFGSRISIEK